MKLRTATLLAFLLHAVWFALFNGPGRSVDCWKIEGRRVSPIQVFPENGGARRASKIREAPKASPTTVSGALDSPSAPAPEPEASPVASRREDASIPMSDIVALGNEAPLYPEEARQQGWEGTVRLRLRPSEKAGTSEPASIEIVQSSGYPVLDEAAVEAARRWKLAEVWKHFSQVAVLIPVEFALVD